MKRILFLAALAGVALACAPNAPKAAGPQRELTLRYDRPAEFFEEALPIGNGRLGAMVYGNPEEERISLNDITLWTGEPDRGMNHPDVAGRNYAGAVEAVREALSKEDYRRAEKLQERLQGHHSEIYQPMGTLRIHHDDPGAVTDYRRELNISDAIASVSYLRGKQPYTATYFASAPDSVIVVRMQYAPGLKALISFDSPQPGHQAQDDNTLRYDGYVAYHAYPGHYRSGSGQFLYDPQRGIHFRTIVHAEAPAGGTITAQQDGLYVSGCPELILYILNSTSFAGFDRDPVKEGLPYKELAEANLSRAKDYSSMIDRFEKKIYDLELTRNISMQMAPQIRLIQNSDTLMTEKIQSTINNTIPLWKNQMVLALGMSHSEEAMKAQQLVTDFTNQLIKENAEKLKQSTIAIAEESEKGIVDLESVKFANEQLITSLDEVVRIQEEGRQKRREAENELGIIEATLKQKLLDIRNSAANIEAQNRKD